MSQKLIDAIRSGDVDKTLEEFGNFICAGERRADELMSLMESGAILRQNDTIKTLAAIYLKTAQLALDYEEGRYVRS